MSALLKCFGFCFLVIEQRTMNIIKGTVNAKDVMYYYSP